MRIWKFWRQFLVDVNRGQNFWKPSGHLPHLAKSLGGGQNFFTLIWTEKHHTNFLTKKFTYFMGNKPKNDHGPTSPPPQSWGSQKSPVWLGLNQKINVIWTIRMTIQTSWSLPKSKMTDQIDMFFRYISKSCRFDLSFWFFGND